MQAFISLRYVSQYFKALDNNQRTIVIDSVGVGWQLENKPLMGGGLMTTEHTLLLTRFRQRRRPIFAAR